MFIIAQLPLADLRPLIKGGKGHLAVPDWASENLDSGFVRGFGKISPRMGPASAWGRAFLCRHKTTPSDSIELSTGRRVDQGATDRTLFRRLYYDGLFDKIACAITVARLLGP